MSSKRVMIFSSSFLPKAGGLQYELKWFLDSLDKWVMDQDEFQFKFVFPSKKSLEFSNFDNIESFDLGYDEFGSGGRLSAVRAIWNLRKVISQEKPQIIHCQGVMPDAGWVYAATLGLRKRPKIVVTSHGQDIVHFPELGYGARLSRRADKFIQFIAKRISMHVLPSAALERFSDEIGVDRSRRTVIPNGVPIGHEPDFEYSGRGGDSESTTTRERGDGEGLRFLSLSSGRPIKNLDVLVKAFASVLPALGDSRLLLACIGPDAVHIRELVDKLGIADYVEFIGEVRGQEKRDIFRSSDVYCQVSHFENSPVSLLESMKFGAAIIASNVGGVPEMIEHEHNGLLVDQNDVSSVASSLTRLVGDRTLYESLVENGKKVVAAHSMYHTIERYAEVYRAVE